MSLRAIGVVGLVVVVAGTVGCGGAEVPDSSDADGVVTIAGGQISGRPAGAAGAVRAYLGLPYAAPPVGALRWQPPRPVEPWDGVRDATRLPPGCVQGVLPGRSDADTPFFGAGATTFDEDCLYLNVWSAARPGDNAPVMVWIHGGGLFIGDGSEVAYDGASLAARGAVIVTINYRLGPFGYLAHPVLRAESAHDASGNYGLLDQIAALQWVQDNIAQFGGDAARVTIFGESAGSWSVHHLMAAPLATGLFARAIGQSGGAFASYRAMSAEEAEEAGEKIARTLLGPDVEITAEALRAIPATEVLAAADGNPRPNVDGWVLPDTVYGMFAAGRQSDVPVIVGANADEGTVLQAIGAGGGKTTLEEYREQARRDYGPLADQFLAVYPAETPDDARVQLVASRGDGGFVWEMRAWARLMETVSSPAYMYVFTRTPPAADAERWGAYHTAEIPYVFNNLGGGSRFWYANRDYDDTDRRLSELVSSFWLHFAATGNPNGEGLPAWPIYSRDTDAVLELGDVVQVRHGVREERLDFFDRHYQAQLGLDGLVIP